MNNDSSWGKKLKKKVRDAITFGLSAKADIYAEKLIANVHGLNFTLCIGEDKKTISLPHIGRFNVENILAAVSIAYSLGICFDEIALRLKTMPTVPGRMEKIENKYGLNIIVDYAHKVEALEKVLISLKEIKKKKLIIVFGCGGERDREKRPLMGALAKKYCDFAVLTNDNPRGENPTDIINEIKNGIGNLDHIVIEDRKEAIEYAIKEAKQDDIILLAGKGHEDEQEMGGKRIFLSDRIVASDMVGVL